MFVTWSVLLTGTVAAQEMPDSLKIQNKTTKGILNVWAIKNRIVSSQLTWINFAEQLFFATI